MDLDSSIDIEYDMCQDDGIESYSITVAGLALCGLSLSSSRVECHDDDDKKVLRQRNTNWTRQPICFATKVHSHIPHIKATLHGEKAN